MYENLFKSIELTMQPAIGLSEINRLTVERITSQQTEYISDCIKTGMEQCCAFTEIDDPQSMTDVQFKYLKLYEQQLSSAVEQQTTTVMQASEAMQKIVGQSVEQFSGMNPFMALFNDLGLKSGSNNVFDFFNGSATTQTKAAKAPSHSAPVTAAATNNSSATKKTSGAHSHGANTSGTHNRSSNSSTENSSTKSSSATDSPTKNSSTKDSSTEKSPTKTSSAKEADSSPKEAPAKTAAATRKPASGSKTTSKSSTTTASAATKKPAANTGTSTNKTTKRAAAPSTSQKSSS